MLLSVLAAAEDVQNCTTLCGKAYEESCALPAAPTNSTRSKQILQEVFFALLRASNFYIADRYLQYAFLSHSCTSWHLSGTKGAQNQDIMTVLVKSDKLLPSFKHQLTSYEEGGTRGEAGDRSDSGQPPQPGTCDAPIAARGGSKRLQDERATLVPMGETATRECSQSLQSLWHSSRLQQGGLWKKNEGCRRKRDKEGGGKKDGKRRCILKESWRRGSNMDNL